ncbi:MAG TPA: right-handed parallel beta-helix repeat-containing protein, partial [Streptomyces sp.]|nr:right-handed parallel beta-helix repeat-containing protein [Streptomyces sp.]
WVIVPPGQYLLATLPLRIYRNTRLTLMNGARFLRGAVGTMLLNGETSQNMGGYSGHGNLIIEGGEWDSRAAVYGTSAMCISIGHAENVIIRDTVIKDVCGYHGIELNSTRQARISNVHGLGYVDPGGRDYSEFIQLDLAKGSAYFGGFGPYDDAVCTNIVIEGCSTGPSGTAGTVAWPRGIGSHSASPGRPHRDIRVRDCRFEGAAQWAIGAYTWEGLVISGVQMRNCGGGVWVRTLDSSKASHRTPAGGSSPTITGSQPLTGITISDVTMVGGGGYGAAVQVEGESTGYVGALSVGKVTAKGVSGNGVRLVYVEDYTVRGIVAVGTGATAISTLGTRRGRFTSCHVNGSGGAGFTVDSRSTPAETATDVSFSGCSVTGVAANGFHMWSGVDVTIADCEAYSLTGYGVQVSTGTTRPVVRNFRHRGTTLAGVNVTSTVVDPLVETAWVPMAGFGAWQNGATANSSNPPMIRDVHRGGTRQREFKGVVQLSSVGTGGYTFFTWNESLRPSYERNWAVATDAGPPARLYYSTAGNMGLTSASGSTRLDMEQLTPMADPPGVAL